MDKVLHHWTPTLLSRVLSKHLAKNVWLKMECYQPVGSFKIRGIGKLCQHYAVEGKTQLVSSSGGNAGLAAAYAGNLLGLKTTVFLPSTSNETFVNAIKLENAEVVVEGDVWDEANEAALAFAQKVNAGFVPPIDHPIIWAGHSTIIDEIVADNITPDCIVVAVGGGGLASGLLEGLHRHKLADIPIITVETKGAASFAKSIELQELITLDAIDTIATSLGAKRVCENIFNWSQKHRMVPVTVSDDEAIDATKKFLNDHRVKIEAASGAPLSLIYNQHEFLSELKSVLVIVCGGIGG